MVEGSVGTVGVGARADEDRVTTLIAAVDEISL